MDLNEFISKSLLDILGAVKQVNEKMPGAAVTGEVVTTADFVKLGVTNLQSVEFEVLVRADQRSGSEAKLNVVAAIIGGGVKGESGETQGHSATLRFKVPVNLAAIYTKDISPPLNP